MNLLAHQVLSFEEPDIQIGNLLGEFVKGNKYKNFPNKIAQGILLHRFIDSYTDKHPVVRRSSKRLHAHHGKYSPIIVDVIYDYFLIKNWHQFMEKPFLDFKNEVYETFRNQMEAIPKDKHLLVQHIISEDWIGNYQTLEGITQTLTGLSQRTIFFNSMNEAIKEVYLYENQFEEDFLEFFPDLFKESEKFLHK